MRKFLAAILLLNSIIGLDAQSSGTSSTLRVRVDANGYLVVTSATQTNPITSSTFNQTRLRTDASGNLQVILAGTVTPTYPQSIPASTCAAPSLGLSGGATTGIAFTSTPTILECIAGTIMGTWSSAGLAASTNLRVASLTATHGVTGVLPASNFSGVGAYSGTNLGADIIGISNTDAVGLAINGINGNNGGTITASPIQIISYVRNGTGVAQIGGGPIIEFNNFNTTYFRITMSTEIPTFDFSLKAQSTNKVGRLLLAYTNLTSYIEGAEQIGDVAAPAANSGRIYFKDNGSGKTQACAIFATGVAQCFATEP